MVHPILHLMNARTINMPRFLKNSSPSPENIDGISEFHEKNDRFNTQWADWIFRKFTQYGIRLLPILLNGVGNVKKYPWSTERFPVWLHPLCRKQKNIRGRVAVRADNPERRL